MAERAIDVLIMGARASQPVHGEQYTNPLVTAPDGTRPLLTFYDPDPAVKLREDLPYLHAARQRGEVRLTHHMPKENYDVAVIATASQYHTLAIKSILATHGKRPPIFVLEKPLATTDQEIAELREVEPVIQPISLTNEPYLLSVGMRALRAQALRQEERGNPVTGIDVWSSKRRKKANPHGDLGIYGIEMPHLHGGASYLAGELLGLSPRAKIKENTYFADVDGIPNNDGNYLELTSGHKRIRIAQGLGRFTMDRFGNMARNETPPRIRQAAVTFADGQAIELDIDPAFPQARTTDAGHSTLRYYTPAGDMVHEAKVADNPRIELARYALRRAQDDSLPNLPHITMTDALERSLALLYIRRNAEVRRGITLAH